MKYSLVPDIHGYTGYLNSRVWVGYDMISKIKSHRGGEKMSMNFWTREVNPSKNLGTKKFLENSINGMQKIKDLL